MLQLNHLGGNPYILAAQKAIEYILWNPNVTASPEMVLHALDVVLTAMNFSSEQIDGFLRSGIFSAPNSLPSDLHIQQLIRKITDIRLLGNWSLMYDMMEHLLNVENTSNILMKVHELVSWFNTTEDSGLYFGIKMLTKLYEVLTPLVAPLSPQSCYSDLFTRLAGNSLYALQNIFGSINLFTPIDTYLKPIQMKLALGDNLRDLVSETQNIRRVGRNLTREPVDDFLDLLEINYRNLSQILSIPLSSEEMLETFHVLFANPDLGIFLKGVTRKMTGSSAEDATIDTVLGTLDYLTRPSNMQMFMETIAQNTGQAWGLDDIQLVKSVGGVVGVMRVLSQQSSLSIAQRVEQLANQLTSAATYTMEHQGNRSEVLTAINNILSQHLQQMLNTSLDRNILHNTVSPVMSQPDFKLYMTVMNQTTEAFAFLVPPQDMVYFNMSARLMEAFASLMSHPTDVEKVVMSSHEVAESLGLSFDLANMTTLSNERPVDQTAYPFILNSALATQILFNLSALNYSLGSDVERNRVLTQMMSSFPPEVQNDLRPLMPALLLALSNVSDTAQIRPVFFQTSQNVSMYLLEFFNLTREPMSTGMFSVLSTVSSEVSACLGECLIGNSSSFSFTVLPHALNALQAVLSSLSLALPAEDQQYPNAIFNFMETVSLALNHTISTGDAAGGMSMLSISVQGLLMTMPNNSMNTSGGVMRDLENTVKTLLQVLVSGQDPQTQSVNVTNEMLSTIQYLLSVANSSSEIDLATAILGAFKMNVGSLLGTNDSNWTQK